MSDAQSVFRDLVRLQIELWNAVDERVRRETGLSLAQFEGMRAIAEREDCRVLDVAEELVITIGGASKLVDRIESRGLCARRAHPGDGRSSLLDLTDAGRISLRRAEAVITDELTTRLEHRLASASLEQLGATLAALRTDPKESRS